MTLENHKITTLFKGFSKMVQEIEKMEVRKEKSNAALGRSQKTKKTRKYRTQTPILYHIFRVVIVGEVAVLIFSEQPSSVVTIMRNHKKMWNTINNLEKITVPKKTSQFSVKQTQAVEYPPSRNLLATDESVK